MKKRVISVLLCSAMAATLLAGCGTKTTTSTTTDATTDATTEAAADDASADDASADLSGTTLTIMASQDWISDAEQDLGAQFEEQTGIHVDYQIVPADQYQDLLLNKLKSDECTDIFMAQSGFALATTYTVQDYAVDLSNESWADSYSVFSAEQTSVDGVNYGMTYYDTTIDYCMVYNKAIFEAAGVTEVPTTFADFEAACEKIAATGVDPIYEPVADTWHHVMLWAENGQVFDKLEPGIIDKLNNNEATFADDEYMLEALNEINDLAQKGYFGDNYLSDDFASADSKLASGAYAMAMLKPGDIETIVADDANTNGYTADDFGLMLMPICDNTYLNVHPTGPSRFIYNQSENVEAAKQYLEFLATQDSIQYMIDNDDSTTNLPIEAGQDPGYSDTTKDFVDSYDDSTSGMVLQDVVKYYNEQWMDIGTNMTSMFIGDMTAEEVLQAIDDGRASLAEAAGDANWQ